MAKFKLIDLDELPRKSQFLHFFNKSGCDFSMTATIDVTDMYYVAKAKGVKFNGAMVYAVSAIANRHKEFRMRINSDGELGYWDYVSPVYSVFHPEQETYSKIWTEHQEDFSKFYKSYQKDLAQYGDINRYTGKRKAPRNSLFMSAIPWIKFDAIHFHSMNGDRNKLSPFLVWGKMAQDQGRVKGPMMLRVNHAVCDGFHVCRFFEEVEDMSKRAEEWLCVEE